VQGQGGDHELAKDASAQFLLGWDWMQAIPDRSTGFFGSAAAASGSAFTAAVFFGAIGLITAAATRAPERDPPTLSDGEPIDRRAFFAGAAPAAATAAAAFAIFAFVVDAFAAVVLDAADFAGAAFEGAAFGGAAFAAAGFFAAVGFVAFGAAVFFAAGACGAADFAAGFDAGFVAVAFFAAGLAFAAVVFAATFVAGFFSAGFVVFAAGFLAAAAFFAGTFAAVAVFAEALRADFTGALDRTLAADFLAGALACFAFAIRCSTSIRVGPCSAMSRGKAAQAKLCTMVSPQDEVMSGDLSEEDARPSTNRRFAGLGHVVSMQIK
ncbi:MAG: hypothetical protein AAFR01_06985, partial [Pseudomonadota bacterium]